jgi:hypothetical protein
VGAEAEAHSFARAGSAMSAKPRREGSSGLRLAPTQTYASPSVRNALLQAGFEARGNAAASSSAKNGAFEDSFLEF